jgi:hypothetical protein
VGLVNCRRAGPRRSSVRTHAADLHRPMAHVHVHLHLHTRFHAPCPSCIMSHVPSCPNVPSSTKSHVSVIYKLQLQPPGCLY